MPDLAGVLQTPGAPGAGVVERAGVGGVPRETGGDGACYVRSIWLGQGRVEEW